MASAPLVQAVEAVPDIDTEDGREKSLSTNSGDRKDTTQQTTEGTLTPEAREDGELDISLPLNWPTRKKFINMAVPSFICFVV